MAMKAVTGQSEVDVVSFLVWPTAWLLARGARASMSSILTGGGGGRSIITDGPVFQKKKKGSKEVI